MAMLIVTAIGVSIAVLADSGDERYRFAAVFDDAQSLVAGHQVKVAGAVAGTVEAVELVAGPKARVVMTLDRRLGPMRADATCSILPQGLISEYYVECEPGVASRPLPPNGSLPTVVLAKTTVPVSLQDVLNVFATPTRQRVTVLLTELGMTTAGRGSDLNGLLRRANPALGSTRRMLAELSAERAALASAVTQTDAVVAELHQRRSDVRRFVSGAAGAARQAAGHRRELGEMVRRLPALLESARPGLASLSAASRRSTPVLEDLRSAAPQVERLASSLPAFTRAGRPAIAGISDVARNGRTTVRAARPVVTQLRRVAGPLASMSGQLDAMLRSTRDTGGLEGLLGVLYGFSTSTALQDNVSHIFSITASVAANCIAGERLPEAPRGCDHSYRGEGDGTVPINAPDCGPKHPSWFVQRCTSIPSPLTGLPVPSAADRSGRARPRPGRTPAPARAPDPTPCSDARGRTPECGQRTPKPLLDELDALTDGITDGQLDETIESLLDFLLK